MINNEKLKKYIEYIIILLIILLSGSVLSMIYYKTIFILFVLTVAIYFTINKFRFVTKNVITLIIIYLVILINFLFLKNNGIKISNIINTLITYLLVFIMANNIDKDDFKYIYTNIIINLSKISLFCMLLSYFNISILMKPVEINGGIFSFSIFHIWGVNAVISTRNFGLFWEPGAYQAFLNLALLFLLTDIEKYKNKFIKIIILILTILTTKSTTGYIILFIIFIYSMSINKFSKNFKKIFKRSMLILFFIFIFISMNTNIISNKLNENNDSFNIRRYDLINSINLIKDKPILGYGLFSDEYYRKSLGAGIVNNSNGLLIIGLMLGIPFMIFCLINISKNINSILNNRWNKYIYILVILLIILLTEHFLLKPIFMIFMYEFYKKNYILKN